MLIEKLYGIILQDCRNVGAFIMIRFIIVDDEVDMQKRMKNIILKETFNLKEEIEIKYFNKYNDELQNIIDDQSIRTIYLLDVDLNEKIDGISIALKIRKNDWNSEIIILTHHDDYFERVYRNIYKVLDFIEKHKNMEERLSSDIKDVINQDYDVNMFKYSTNQVDLQVYNKDILYIYRDTQKRKLVIVTTHNIFLINSTIKTILQKLDYRFKQVHRACIVNTKHVNLYKWNDGSFILDNNEEIFLLSKKYKNNIKKENIFI